MDARKSEVPSQGEIVNDTQIFFEVIGPPTRACVPGMGAGVKPRDVYGPSSSSQCSKQRQVDLSFVLKKQRIKVLLRKWNCREKSIN